jgi:hypothetical protein
VIWSATKTKGPEPNSINMKLVDVDATIWWTIKTEGPKCCNTNMNRKQKN